MVLAGIQKKPLASFRGTRPNISQLIRSKQICSRTGNRPEHAIEVKQIVEPPFKTVLHLNQLHVPRSSLSIVIESREPTGRHRALVHDRPKNIVDRLAQFSAPEQSLLRPLRIGITALVKPVHLRRLKQPSVFAESGEIDISLQQFFGLDVSVVERVHEVQADVARNQIEARRTSPCNFPSLFSLRQKISFLTHYLTIKTRLTS